MPSASQTRAVLDELTAALSSSELPVSNVAGEGLGKSGAAFAGGAWPTASYGVLVGSAGSLPTARSSPSA